MAMRANLMEINDLQNGIRVCQKELENLQLFETGQNISRPEKRRLSEERRKIQMNLQYFSGRVSELEKENVLITFIYILLFVMVIGIRCTILSDKWIRGSEQLLWRFWQSSSAEEPEQTE
ncbi:uncharacterized protein [Littorina saxatilis]|uniref:Uncharacterized protein n=1 Tax=Littorina saxatilis TaxID=31220 RepID=A0AAN9BDY8_9CAEN